MAFDVSQTTPWPLWRRVQIAAGVSFAIPDMTLTLRQWVFDPHLVITLPGQPVTGERQNVPRRFGPHWAQDSAIGHPLRAQFFWFQLAVRVLGFDLGFDAWYRCRDAHKQERKTNGL